jgi:hypothetical protein
MMRVSVKLEANSDWMSLALTFELELQLRFYQNESRASIIKSLIKHRHYEIEIFELLIPAEGRCR